PENGDWITTRRISDSPNPERLWQYNRSTEGTLRVIAVVSPVSDQIVHKFNAQGEEVSTQWKSSTGTTLKTVTSSWTQTEIETNGQANNPLVNTAMTTLDMMVQSSQTVTYDTNLNMTQVDVT